MYELNPIVDVPQKLLLDLAVGLDSFEDICTRYNYTSEQAEALRANPGIKTRVAQIAAELKESGVTFRLRNAHAAEDMIGVIWAEARRADTSLDKKIEAAKLFAKLGDLEPRTKTDGVSGGGVTISINIPALSAAQTAQSITIDQDMNKPLITLETQPSKNHDLMLPEEYEYEYAECT